MKTRGAAPEPGPSLTCAECVASCGAQQHADGSVELSSCQFHGQSPFTHGMWAPVEAVAPKRVSPSPEFPRRGVSCRVVTPRRGCAGWSSPPPPGVLRSVGTPAGGAQIGRYPRRGLRGVVGEIPIQRRPADSEVLGATSRPV